MKYTLFFFALASITLCADIAWIDIDSSGGSTAGFHKSLVADNDASVSSNNITFTLFGDAGIDSRDRSLTDAMLTDFAFLDGSGAELGLRIEGLPAGAYDVESWHYDGGGFDGAIEVEFREQGQAGALLRDNFVFSTEPATYQITSDGSKTYELIFCEDDENNRSRFNGLRLRAAGEESSPPLIFVNADNSNTVASGGSPSPFWSSSSSTGNLWKVRPGFGFDVNGNTEVYEKDAQNSGNNVGDATSLKTSITGLTPGQEYAVYVCYVSVPDESWRVRAGLTSDSLIEFQPATPADRVFDLGQSGEEVSNRNQYLGFVGNATADGSGSIVVHVDDGAGTSNSSRTWYEGVAVGDPYLSIVVPALPGGAVELAPDGAWTWFNDERAIVHGGAIYVGYVRKDGHVGLSRYDPKTGIANHMQLSTAASQQVDDHNNPSLTVLPDGRLLAIYSKHNSTWAFFYRISTVNNPSSDSDWSEEFSKATPASNTYANTYRLSGESNKIYNFHRCINFNPTLTLSTDNGETWSTPTQFIATGAGGTRPYPRYCSNHEERIDLIYTDGHPRNSNNSIYHLYYADGNVHATDGTVVKALSDIPLDHDSGERGAIVYPYSNTAWGTDDGPDDWIPTGRGWTWDICYGTDGDPVCVFQVQRDNVTGGSWDDDRIYYYYARCTGTEWQRRFIAHGGRGIYSGERDYGGGMTIDPEDPRVVYISTNAANPFDLDRDDINDVPLSQNERYEIWRGFTADGGLTFEWTAVTENSEADNLRPIVPENHGRTRQLIWFYGTYNTYTNYTTQVIGIVDTEKETFIDWQGDYGINDANPGDNSDFDGLEDLLEYSLGGDPTDPTDAPAPTYHDEAFSFRYLPARTDVEWVIQRTTDLLSWNSIATIRAAGLPNTIASGYTIHLDGGNPAMLSISPDIPFTDSVSFMRLNVRKLP